MDYETTSAGILDFMQSKLWTIIILREDSQIDFHAERPLDTFPDPLLQSIHRPKLTFLIKQNLRPIVLERNENKDRPSQIY